MATTSSTLWGIHAGKTGDADRLFLTQNVMAPEWADAGDLSKLSQKRKTRFARDSHPSMHLRA
jgi:restriction system protein